MRRKIEVLEEDVLQQELVEEIPCRINEIDSVLELIGRPKNKVPQSIFIYGDRGSGKRYVTSRILEKLQYRHVFINCIQCYLPKLLFGCILKEISGCHLEISGETGSFVNCDNILDFIKHLKVASSSYKRDAYIIVLEKCERLRSMDSNLLSVLLRMQELTKLNICVIFMSSIIWEKFYLTTGFYEPLQIIFPQYNKDEVFKILTVKHPWQSATALYQNYLNFFLCVFYRSCRDLNELQYMVNVNFLKHCEPVLSGRLDPAKLWQSIMPHLKAALKDLYLRTKVSSGPEEKHDNFQQLHDKVIHTKLPLSVELPFYSKYFLIAAYLASYSPSKLDKTLFIKLSDKKKRKRARRSNNEVLSVMLLGPKPFTIDRLLAIFCSIVDGEVRFTANLSAQVSALVKLQLFMPVDNSIDCQKFKCAVGLELIRTIAKSVGFDIMKYLFSPK